MTALRPCETCNRLVAAEEMVTISAAEYRELLARPAPSKKPVGRRVGFRLVRDPELGRFVYQASLSGEHTLQRLTDMCIERYGSQRTPSIKSLHRYLTAIAKGRIAPPDAKQP